MLVIHSWNSIPNRLRAAARLAGSTYSSGRGTNGEPSWETHLRSMPTENAFSPEPEKTTARTEGSVERRSKTDRSSSHTLKYISRDVVNWDPRLHPPTYSGESAFNFSGRFISTWAIQGSGMVTLKLVYSFSVILTIVSARVRKQIEFTKVLQWI